LNFKFCVGTWKVFSSLRNILLWFSVVLLLLCYILMGNSNYLTTIWLRLWHPQMGKYTFPRAHFKQETIILCTYVFLFFWKAQQFLETQLGESIYPRLICGSQHFFFCTSIHEFFVALLFVIFAYPGAIMWKSTASVCNVFCSLPFF
jgi:hypothetical protein